MRKRNENGGKEEKSRGNKETEERKTGKENTGKGKEKT